MSRYSFLVDTYETEILKTIGTWETFPDDAMDFRPAPKSRTVLEQFEHQLKSEGAWMRDMLGIDVGEILPAGYTKLTFIEKQGGRNEAPRYPARKTGFLVGRGGEIL
jgi:hypothetical protein